MIAYKSEIGICSVTWDKHSFPVNAFLVLLLPCVG
jgi:hypothetical protein